MTQREPRVGNLTIRYCKKQLDGSFSCVCPPIDKQFRHNIVCGSNFYFDNVMMKFISNNTTDARKTEETKDLLHLSVRLEQLLYASRVHP